MKDNMRDKVLYLFNKKRQSAYSIHCKTGVSIKEIYHYIKQSEESREAHQRQLAENKRCEHKEEVENMLKEK